MLTGEETMLLKRLEESVFKLEANYDAGLITEAEYREKCGFLDEAAEKIEAICKQTR